MTTDRVVILCGECGGSGFVNERYVDVDLTDADKCETCGGAGEYDVPACSVTDRDEVLVGHKPGRRFPPMPVVPINDTDIPF